MDNPLNKTPQGAVAGLSDVLLALGEELRAANHKVGEFEIGEGEKQPVLFLGGASVELSVAFEASSSGGVNVWVIEAEASGHYEKTATITVQLNTEGSLPVGM